MVTLTVAAVKKLIPDAFREVFLLKRAQRAVEGRSADQQVKIRELANAFDSRLAVVESLTAGDQVPPALVLLRDAAVLAIRAVLESRGIESTAEAAESAFQKIAPLIESGELPSPPKDWQRVRELLSDTRHLAFDELPTADALARRSEAEAVVAWLRGLVDARSVSEIKVSRALRLGVALVLLVGVVVWAVSQAVAPRNIALGKPAQMSSRRPNCPAGSGEAGMPPSGAVDGNRTGAYDICTSYEARPWLTIDLQRVHKLSRAVIYYRGDCCFGSFDLPAVLELSEDGTNFVEVGRRTTPYSAQDPWKVPLDGKRAKIVRLRVDSPDMRELVLNEVEIYASRW
jgi:hypothetical protein